MGTIPHWSAEIPSLTIEQMIAVDRAMVEHYQITLIQMMENAGRNLARLARERFFAGNPKGVRVVVLAGTGGNGGGGLVGARHLANWGADVTISLTRPAEEYTGVPAQQLATLLRMNTPVVQPNALGSVASPALIVDSVIGYSLHGAPRGNVATLIRWANSQDAPILALDLPSGIDATTGSVGDPTINAVATMTLALPKIGLRAPEAAAHVGELYLADISVPPSLYAMPAIGLHVGHVFSASEIVRLW